jgi:hypothetical protein
MKASYCSTTVGEFIRRRSLNCRHNLKRCPYIIHMSRFPDTRKWSFGVSLFMCATALSNSTKPREMEWILKSSQVRRKLLYSYMLFVTCGHLTDQHVWLPELVHAYMNYGKRTRNSIPPPLPASSEPALDPPWLNSNARTTEFKVNWHERPCLWSSGQSSWLQNEDVLFSVRYELNLYVMY